MAASGGDAVDVGEQETQSYSSITEECLIRDEIPRLRSE